MRLVVSTPTAVIADVARLAHIRAEDETGAFGILPGHADFITVLPVSVVGWSGDGKEGFLLVRGGVLRVSGGCLTQIAARGAWREDQLEDLGSAALDALEQGDAEEDVTRTSDARLHLAAMRQIERVLRATRDGSATAPRLDRRAGDKVP
jgi:F-type H+-transporting ATPase subunit epsilon